MSRLGAGRQVGRMGRGGRAALDRLLERPGFKKTSESRRSLRNAPEGKPMPFVGYDS